MNTPMTDSVRILVTGSRSWTDRHAIGDALRWGLEQHAWLVVPDRDGPLMQWAAVTVVHGAARGADTIAARIAAAWGMNVEAHPADWVTHGQRAGLVRNSVMVALGADVCLGFPLGESRGTRHCMRAASAAGILVVDWTARTPS